MAEKKSTFSAEEKAAMKEYAAEKRNQAKVAKTAAEKAANLKMCTDAIKKMIPADRKIVQAIHEIVLEEAPHLQPKTWYGMPAYANAEGKPVLFCQDAAKFKNRYVTIGFTMHATLDKGESWPISWAILEMTPELNKKLRTVIKQAARGSK